MTTISKVKVFLCAASNSRRPLFPDNRKPYTVIVSGLGGLLLHCTERLTEKLLDIKGVGIKTVSGFLAEVGDISRFDNPKQLQKLAGQAIKENSSGKHKGETTITKRGRKRLRYLLHLGFVMRKTTLLMIFGLEKKKFLILKETKNGQE